MSKLNIRIEGIDARKVAKDLLSIEELSGTYDIIDDFKSDPTIPTIVAIVTITIGTLTSVEKSLTLAEKFHGVFKKYQSTEPSAGSKTERVISMTIENPDVGDISFKNLTVEETEQLLKSLKKQ